MADDLSKLGLVDLLARIEEGPDPEPISWFPQTSAWAWLAFFLSFFLFLAILWAYRNYKANSYRRYALGLLRKASDDPAEIASVLRRTALSAYPRAQVAGLQGDDWIAFLQKSCPKLRIDREAAARLCQAAYQSNQDPRLIQPLAETWIKHHQREGSAL